MAVEGWGGSREPKTLRWAGAQIHQRQQAQQLPQPQRRLNRTEAQTSNLRLPPSPRQRAPTGGVSAASLRCSPLRPRLGGPPGRSPGDPHRGEETRGSEALGQRGLVSPRQPRAPQEGAGKMKDPTGTILHTHASAGLWDGKQRGGDDVRCLSLGRGLHLRLPVSYPATAILKPRAPPP